MKRTVPVLTGVVLSGLLALGAVPVQAEPPGPPPGKGGGSGPGRAEDARQRLFADAGGKAVVRRDPASGQVVLVGTAPGQSPRRPSSAAGGPEAAARDYVGRYAALLGLPADSQLAARSLRGRADGDRGTGTTVRLRQQHRGVPVFGAEIAVALTPQHELLSLTAGLSDSPAVATEPRTTAAAAQQAAEEHVASKTKASTAQLEAKAPALAVLDLGLLDARDTSPAALVWQTTVTGAGLRWQVLVDANDNAVRLAYDDVHEARNRAVCDGRNVPSWDYACMSPVRKERMGPVSIPAVDQVFDYTGHTYNFFRSRYGRDSYDGAGARMAATVRYCHPFADCPYLNAFWDGTQTTFGDGLGSDDVVGHEWAHAVTESEAGLIYRGESGAINEAMSDVFGEAIDQTNAAGNDTAAVKWDVGEDTSLGAIRDMADPTLFGQPDRRTSPNWYDGPGDNGGVHINSGVANKAAFLLAQGQTFNGVTVTAIGLTDTTRIFYTALTDLLTPISGYRALATALPQACANLVGTGTITSSDCTQVLRAVDATDMDFVEPPPGNDAFSAAQVAAPTFQDGRITTSATTETGEPSTCGTATIGKTVWYQVTPTSSARLAVSTETSSFDTVVSVYRGSAVNALTRVTCNDDSQGAPTSYVAWTPTAGTTYWIQVGGYESDAGRLRFALGRPPSHDSFSTPRTVTTLPYNAPATDTRLATVQTGEPTTCDDVQIGKTVWHRFSSPTTRTVTVASSGYDTVLAVYTGASVGALTQIGCNDDTGGIGVGSEVTFTATAGTTYWVQVGGYYGDGGTLAFSARAA